MIRAGNDFQAPAKIERHFKKKKSKYTRVNAKTNAKKLVYSGGSKDWFIFGYVTESLYAHPKVKLKAFHSKRLHAKCCVFCIFK